MDSISPPKRGETGAWWVNDTLRITPLPKTEVQYLFTVPSSTNSPVVVPDGHPAERADQVTNLHVENVDETALESATLQGILCRCSLSPWYRAWLCGSWSWCLHPSHLRSSLVHYTRSLSRCRKITSLRSDNSLWTCSISKKILRNQHIYPLCLFWLVWLFGQL